MSECPHAHVLVEAQLTAQVYLVRCEDCRQPDLQTAEAAAESEPPNGTESLAD